MYYTDFTNYSNFQKYLTFESYEEDLKFIKEYTSFIGRVFLPLVSAINGQKPIKSIFMGSIRETSDGNILFQFLYETGEFGHISVNKTKFNMLLRESFNSCKMSDLEYLSELWKTINETN